MSDIIFDRNAIHKIIRVDIDPNYIDFYEDDDIFGMLDEITTVVIPKVGYLDNSNDLLLIDQVFIADDQLDEETFCAFACRIYKFSSNNTNQLIKWLIAMIDRNTAEYLTKIPPADRCQAIVDILSISGRAARMWLHEK